MNENTMFSEAQQDAHQRVRALFSEVLSIAKAGPPATEDPGLTDQLQARITEHQDALEAAYGEVGRILFHQELDVTMRCLQAIQASRVEA